MKLRNLFYLSLFLTLSCGSVSNSSRTYNTGTLEQVFIKDLSSSLIGKCYAKAKLNSESRWTETICGNHFSKALTTQIQDDLISLGFEIIESEKSEKRIGPSTKEAFKQFQFSQELFSGVIDWATVNRLRLAASNPNELLY